MSGIRLTKTAWFALYKRFNILKVMKNVGIDIVHYATFKEKQKLIIAKFEDKISYHKQQYILCSKKDLTLSVIVETQINTIFKADDIYFTYGQPTCPKCSELMEEVL